MSDHLRDMELEGYVDEVIDEINDRMQTAFPTFSEWNDFVIDYNDTHAEEEDFVPLDPEKYTAFPAKYLRRVVAVGAALKFFTNDEEGEQVAGRFYIEYEQALGIMLRDYTNKVSDIFLAEEGGGYIDTSFNERDEFVESNEGLVLRDV